MLRTRAARSLRATLAAALLLLGLAALPSAAGSVPRPADPAFVHPLPRMDAALRCPPGRLQRPVLLVHGTGSTGAESWARGWEPALRTAGFAPCTVDLPGRSTGDAQISGEYVARALSVVSRRAGGARVAAVGWSQGGTNIRWALRFFPSTRALVSDVVTLAATHHGTIDAEALCALPCVPSVHQQRKGSAYLAALNRGAEVLPGIPTTSIYSASDEIVPHLPEGYSAALRGARNVLVQDVCPVRPVTHAGQLYDGFVWAVALDALRHPGPADVRRLPAGVCGVGALPGVDGGDLLSLAGPTLVSAAVAVATGPVVAAEPSLRPYAR